MKLTNSKNVINLKKIFAGLSILILISILSSCTTSVSQIKYNPSQYDGKTVEITGEVVEVYYTKIDGNNGFKNRLIIYKLEDNGDYLYVITDKDVIKGSIRKTNGKLFYLKNKNDPQQIQIFYRYLYTYLDEKGYLEKKSQKSEQFFVWHIFKFLINIFTDFKFDDSLDDLDDAVLYSLENQPDKKEVIEDAMNKILFNLEDSKKIVIIFENTYEVY